MSSLLLQSVSEEERIAVLDSFNILDTAPEAGFDDVVLLAREVCHTPIALVSLVASDRQWFKAASGLDACETPLEQSVCAHALRQNATLIIPDLTSDPRTRNNALVTGDPFIRFYAGALLRTSSGINLGTLCVIDTEPRPGGLSDSQIVSLEALARQVIVQLELRRAMSLRDDALADQQTEKNAYRARAVESERLTTLLRANEARLRLAQEAGNVGTFEIHVASNQIAASEEFCRIFGLPFRPSFDADEVEHLIVPGDEALISSREMRQGGDLKLSTEYRIRRPDNGNIVWISRHALFLKDASGIRQRMIGTVQDITERKSIEDRQRLLNQELSHRMKNTMALVQAIASQTLRGASDRSAVQAFGQRITALSHAHDVLLEQNWTAASMRDVIKRVLRLHDEADRFNLTGPELDCGPKTVLALSLLIHELATNAVKYGALSVAGGRVEIAWNKVGDDMLLTWTETGGPPATEPTTTGLGSRLIDMGLAGTRQVSKRYDSTGFSAEFRAPIALIKASQG
jgi:PAS domain S-box-containing protein